MPPDILSSELSIFFSARARKRRARFPGTGRNGVAGGCSDQRRQILGASGPIDGGQHGLSEALQHAAVGVRKCIAPEPRKLREFRSISRPTRTGTASMERMPSARQLSRSTRASSFGIIAAEQRSGLHALPGKTGSHLQACTDGRSIQAGTGATNHEIRIGVRRARWQRPRREPEFARVPQPIAEPRQDRNRAPPPGAAQR